MNTDYFFVQDQAGTRCKVNVLRAEAGDGKRSPSERSNAPLYRLEDGSALQRVDSDTFRVAGTGAFVALVRD